MTPRTAKIYLATVGAASTAMLVLAACGGLSEANNYNLPDPPATGVHNIRDYNAWTRIDSPQNYPTVMRGCIAGDGIYIDQDSSSSVEVVPNDPACK